MHITIDETNKPNIEALAFVNNNEIPKINPIIAAAILLVFPLDHIAILIQKGVANKYRNPVVFAFSISPATFNLYNWRKSKTLPTYKKGMKIKYEEYSMGRE